MTFPVIAGDTLPAFLGAQPGSHALVREYDTRGNGGGFCSILIRTLTLYLER